MELRLIGAGLGRTGTNSLKGAVERLTGGRCYHMSELIERPQDTATWTAAVIDGQMPDWATFLGEFSATLDWPACAFWRELAGAFPDAPVLLSKRTSAESWWASMEKTIVQAQDQVPDTPEWAARRAMVKPMLLRFCPEWPDRDAVIAAYERHNDEVRRRVAPERLVEWTTGDGWQPICDALGVPVPDEPFPHTNTAADFRRAMELEPGEKAG
jgi:hypothetical protein